MDFTPQRCKEYQEAKARKASKFYESKSGWARHLGSQAHLEAVFIVENRHTFIGVTPAVVTHLQANGIEVETILGPPVVSSPGGPKRRSKWRANPWVHRKDLQDALEDRVKFATLSATLTKLYEATQNRNYWGPVSF